ncbi:response regulator transcription factor [Roseobacter sp. HKCCA0434]|uniref:response regulator transcription factor n=1 Tax=Roseobacter sp. HKCCA0434 TaxID=3079297 RepID=UPI002905E324|nr:response regulator transcription factor [Roseobacter sp. HKCCA0434]
MTQPVPSVLIVEDRIHTANRMRAAIEAQPRLALAGVAHMLDTGLQLLHERRPDFLLADLGLPDGNGLELIRAARAADWPCDVMVVSVFGDERRVIDAIRAGAKGYILKTSSQEDIAAAILSVIDGGSPMSPQIARYLLRLVGDPREGGGGQGGVTLTQREAEILAIVAKGYRRQEIADQLSISIGTVGNHINNIYRKLEVGSNIEAVARATRMGLL